MDRKELQQRLLATFRAELEEHLTTLNRDLLALEKADGADARRPLLQALFRAAHSVKGAARSVSSKPIEAAAHRLEELLAGARDGSIVLDRPQFERLYAAIDALATARGTPEPAAPAPAAAAPLPAAPGPTPDGYARVATVRLEALLEESGEVMIAQRRLDHHRASLDGIRDLLRLARAEQRASGGSRAATRRADERLAQLERQLDATTAGLALDLRRLAAASGSLHEEIRRVRTVPVAELAPTLERAARDAAVSTGKEVELALHGGEVEIDRQVLQRLKDPLLHLVRNAVDHGIETPEQRAAAGKPARGRVVVSAELRGAEVSLTVADDGRGLDLAAIRAAAARRGMLAPASAAAASAAIFAPGFSTAVEVTDLSGRGVGLDVVKEAALALHGAVDLASTPGHGVRIELRVPVTLSTVRALLLGAGDDTFALPASAVKRLLRFAADDVARVEGRAVLRTDDGAVPLARLSDILGLPSAEPGGQRPRAVVLRVGTRTLALVVDRLLDEREILLAPLGRHLRGLRHVLGATLLPDGDLALVLSAAELVQLALALPVPALPERASAEEQKARRILIADDSLTTRSLEKSIVESAGYEVTAVADGEEAWRILQEKPFDLVISDVEMPRMDGFALTETIRSSRRLQRLPVVLVSALASDADRTRGLAAGASAYIPKGTFDQRELLDTIAQLL